MKHIYAILPVLLPITTAASLKKDFSTEERLRDHMAMFRHVLHGDKEPQVSAEILHSPKVEPFSAPVFIQNVETIQEGQPDQTSMSEPPSSEMNHTDGDPGKTDTQSLPKSTNNILPEGEFKIWPIAQPADVPGDVLPLSGLPNQPAALPELGSQMNTPSSQENTAGDSKGDDSMTNESVADPVTLIPGESAPNAKTLQPLLIDNPKEETSDEGEYPEDARLPSLLATGLKQLLSNGSDFSAVFEFPEMQPKTVTLTVTTHTIPGIFTATSTDRTTFQTDNVTPETVTSSAENAVPTDFLKVPVIDSDHDSPMTVIEGKANLKSVLDMVRDRRKPSSELSRQKKGTKPRSYIEHTNSTKVIDAPQKVHLKDFLGKEPSDSLTYNEPKFQDNPEPETPASRRKNKLRASQQSVSDIRKLYFQSLERSANEDLMSYFQRIYPELELLLGKPLSDSDNTEANSLLKKLSEDLQKAGLPSLS